MKILKSMMICLAMMLVLSVVPAYAEETAAVSLIGDIVFKNATGDENKIETTTGEVSFSFVPAEGVTARRVFTAVVLKYSVTAEDFFASDDIGKIATIAQAKLADGEVTFNVNLFNEPTGKHTVIVSYAEAVEKETYKTADFKYVNPNKIDDKSKTVVQNINIAIGAQSSTSIETIFKTADDVKAFSELNGDRILAANDDAIEKAAKVIAAAKKFEADDGSITYNEIEKFCAAVNEAFAYAELGCAKTGAEVKSAVEFYNDAYYGLDLKNEVFKANSDKVYGYMAGNGAADKDGAKDAFMYGVIRTDIENTNYSDIYDKVGGYLVNLSGVDTDKFEDIDDTDAFGRHLLNNIENAKSLDDIADLIDEYEETSGGGGFGGGGSSGGGGFSGGGISAPISNISVGTEIVADAKKPAEKAALFSDLPASHWAYASVEYMLGKGAVGGYEDGTFVPSGSVTRAEFVKMAVKLFGITLAEDSEAPTFDDVSETDWFYADVTAAAASGLVMGSGNSFNPNAKITRQEIAVILNRYIENTGKNPAKVNAPVVFTDGDSIANWAFESVVTLQQIGIVGGFEDGTFAPSNGATRAEAATMLYRLDTAKEAEIQEVAETNEE